MIQKRATILYFIEYFIDQRVLLHIFVKFLMKKGNSFANHFEIFKNSKFFEILTKHLQKIMVMIIETNVSLHSFFVDFSCFVKAKYYFDLRLDFSHC